MTESRTRRLIQGSVKQTQFCVSFIALWWQNLNFKRHKAVSYLIGLYCEPYPCSWILGSHWKNTIPSTSGTMGFMGSVHGVTYCATKCAAVKVAEPWMSNHRMPTKDWRSPAGHAHGKRTRWSDCISDRAWSRRSAEPAELSEIAFDREVFWVLLGLRPLPQFLEEVQTWKWWKIYWNGFCEVFMDVQLRFQVYFSHMKC